MRINHNIPALRSLHQLDKSNAKLDKTLERLSSGLRINHAADDAAGLAITQKMDTQVRGLKQAKRNAMDGISLIQTAEGALNEVHSMLQRIRELAVQVSNGTYDPGDRKAVQDEVTQLQNEIQRISSDIEFNEMKLLNGNIDRRAFSTDDNIATIVTMSDTVDAGEYSFEVLSAAKQTSDTGGKISMFDANGKATVGGIININGEQTTIKVGDSSENVYAKIRDLCSTVDVSCSIDSAPFTDGKKLTLQMNKFGERKLTVTGNVDLLKGLGLDAAQFNPNAEAVYHSKSTDFDTNDIVNAGTVLVNGVEVTLAAGDDAAAIAGKLQAVTIPGVEFALNGNGKIDVISSKPVTVIAKDSSNPTTLAKNQALATELVTLEAKTNIKSTSSTEGVTAARTSATQAVDTSKTTAASADIKVTVNGTSVTIPVDNIALTDANLQATVIPAMNAALVAGGVNNTIISYDDVAKKLVAYNTDGHEVTFEDAGANAGADTDLYNWLGFNASPNTEVQNKIGTIGRDVQINTATLVYDDTATTEVDGFPKGTTVSTKGKDITFQSNDNFELKLQSNNAIGKVTMSLLETGPLDLQIGANEGQFMEIRIQNLSPTALGIHEINLATSDGAQEAITTVDNAITTVSAVRSKLGAYQNRLEYTTANLDAASENMTASLSRIQDADMAYEMAQFTQQNIIQQAGTSMLAQANQRPQSLLQLLQG